MIGQMVLIKEDFLPINTWPLGRILEVYHGSDGKVRVVKVKTQSGEFKRAISKIAVLPIDTKKSNMDIINFTCHVLYHEIDTGDKLLVVSRSYRKNNVLPPDDPEAYRFAVGNLIRDLVLSSPEQSIEEQRKDPHCQVIYSQFGLAIHQNDHQARRRFVEWAQNEIAVVPDFHKRILFSDEAHFWLNGYVNKQNCRIWSEANPQVYVETPLHPEKLTVRCALWAGGIIGPYFFKNDEGPNVTVNGDR
ncbi:uncharacterized protein TNCV_3368991 [Trichonephila clavipes]|uniref:DUF5641 domain-containing protein n=1 Tax=Trichonephila clavipes TaxID=2585209 RepID=A0A8X6UZ88_TRICX|nr:uncharacterized protein TNCV_3368991 [Trichonephila clavipes]